MSSSRRYAQRGSSGVADESRRPSTCVRPARGAMFALCAQRRFKRTVRDATRRAAQRALFRGLVKAVLYVRSFWPSCRLLQRFIYFDSVRADVDSMTWVSGATTTVVKRRRNPQGQGPAIMPTVCLVKRLDILRRGSEYGRAWGTWPSAGDNSPDIYGLNQQDDKGISCIDVFCDGGDGRARPRTTGVVNRVGRLMVSLTYRITPSMQWSLL